jgi:cleavage and polyadenylation specificity factor subunit 4
MAADVAHTPVVDQLVNPASKPAHYSFSFDDFLKREYRFGIPSDRPVCKAYMAGHCPLGNSCPDKHPAKATQYNK